MQNSKLELQVYLKMIKITTKQAKKGMKDLLSHRKVSLVTQIGNRHYAKNRKKDFSAMVLKIKTFRGILITRLYISRI